MITIACPKIIQVVQLRNKWKTGVEALSPSIGDLMFANAVLKRTFAIINFQIDGSNSSNSHIN